MLNVNMLSFAAPNKVTNLPVRVGQGRVPVKILRLLFSPEVKVIKLFAVVNAALESIS